jgi:hypothetical protein
MFGSTILDIAIGLIFVYLLLSLMCSAAKELIEGWVRHRASDLEQGVMDLLDNSKGGLGTAVLNHGLIKGLVQQGKTPSYIPAQTFALALMDCVTPGGAQGALAPPGTVPPLPALRLDADNLASRTVSRALVSLIDSAGADAAKVRENIETWFNTAMDRLSGRYKRRTQNVVFLLGMLLAGLMNVDSVKIADALSHDAALRNSLVAAAQEYVKNPPPTVGQPVAVPPVATPAAPAPAPSPAAAAPAAKPAAPAPSAPAPAPAKTPADDIKSLSEKIGSLGLPLGWKKDATSWTDPLELLQKILGLLITSLAITLGAPFWFDTLNRIINVRAAIKPQTPAK